MSSAQSRAIKQQAQRLTATVRAKDEVLDVLIAVLADRGGRIAVPLGVVESSFRDEIVVQRTDDELIVMTASRAKREEAPAGIVRRVLGSLFGG